MTQRLTPFVEGEYYHTYSRGTDKRVIFKDATDYRRFIELLYLSNCAQAINVRDIRKTHPLVYEFERGDLLVHIGAYCLMPNHFHILLAPAVDQGVKLFMQKLLTGYSMYFNKRYERRGALFEGRFKSQHAKSDEYLKYLFSYIHLNPIKLIQSDWKERGITDLSGARKYLATYQYSSFLDYSGNRERYEEAIICPEKFPQYFPAKKDVDDEMIDWLSYKEL